MQINPKIKFAFNKTLLFYLSFAFFLMIAPAFAADTVVFPPTGCVNAEPRAITYQVDAPNTQCSSGQDLVKMALKNLGCKEGESIILDAKGNTKCGGSSNHFVGWWSAAYSFATVSLGQCSCQDGSYSGDGRTSQYATRCEIPRGCSAVYHPDMSWYWGNCKIAESDYKVNCGGQMVPLGGEYILSCTSPHLETGGCSCPVGTTAVLYSQNYDNGRYYGGWNRTWVCK